MRKAYFRMAQKYHPDKNPEGRVSQSYQATSALKIAKMFFYSAAAPNILFLRRYREF